MARRIACFFSIDPRSSVPVACASGPCEPPTSFCIRGGVLGEFRPPSLAANYTGDWLDRSPLPHQSIRVAKNQNCNHDSIFMEIARYQKDLSFQLKVQEPPLSFQPSPHYYWNSNCFRKSTLSWCHRAMSDQNGTGLGIAPCFT